MVLRIKRREIKMLEIKSEGRDVRLRQNPASQNYVIIVNDSQVELTASEIAQIATQVLGPESKPAQQETKKGK